MVRFLNAQHCKLGIRYHLTGIQTAIQILVRQSDAWYYGTGHLKSKPFEYKQVKVSYSDVGPNYVFTIQISTVEWKLSLQFHLQ